MNYVNEGMYKIKNSLSEELQKSNRDDETYDNERINKVCED